MGSTLGYLCDDQIAFGDLRFDRKLEIRKGCADGQEMLSLPFNSSGMHGIRVVIDELLGHELAERIQLARCQA